MSTIAILLSPLPLRYSSFIARKWGQGILVVAGVKVKKVGMENVDPKKPSIYMPNHASMIDIPVLLAHLPVDLRFLYKQSLRMVPFLGQAIMMMGMVSIDRSRLDKARVSLKKAGDRIRRGTHLLVFPEGTRTPTGRLLSFKKGGFYLAIQEDIDVVPVSLNGTRPVGGRNTVWINSGEVEMVVHPRISMEPFNIEQRAEAVEAVRSAIDSRLTGSYRLDHDTKDDRV